MCYNIEFVERRAKKLEERYKNLPPPYKTQTLPEELPVYYFVSGFSHPVLPIVKDDGIFLFEWGLIPPWIKDSISAKEIQTKTLNAVGETVFEKPSFKQSIATHRCLLPVNGFYEWRDVNKIKYPYLISLKSNAIFSLGCIYESWVDKSTGEEKNTFSILTTPANPLMEKIHNLKKRMPLILKQEDEAKWVNPKRTAQQVADLIKPYDDADMQAYTISQIANGVKNNRNVEEIINPVEYPELF
jgi:putative SOS response-associated peptidase YedK